jgi:predicted signal transduction protein with EAL and GGDEF domain
MISTQKKNFVRKKMATMLIMCLFTQVALFTHNRTAQAAWLPYGGMVVSTVVCTCTPSVWWIFVAGPLPSVSGAFAYVSGSQRYRNFNMPFSRYVLGLYIPGVPSCWFWVPAVPPFCVPIYQQGTITPISGSSAL